MNDEKNVRRRVYDALNVLEAVGMLEKDKKDIRWRGWPNTGEEDPAQRLELEQARRVAAITRKASLLNDVNQKAFCLSQLVLRNRDAPLPALVAAQEGGMQAPNPLALPFILVQASGDAEIDVAISEDQKTAELDFHHWPFHVYDDEAVMKLMGIGNYIPELLVGNNAALASQLAAEDKEYAEIIHRMQQQQRRNGGNVELQLPVLPRLKDGTPVLVGQHEMPSSAANIQQQRQQHDVDMHTAPNSPLNANDETSTPNAAAAAGHANGHHHHQQQEQQVVYAPLPSPPTLLSAMDLSTPSDKGKGASGDGRRKGAPQQYQ